MTVLVDTGVLVALIDPDTREHQWAQDWSKRLPQPFLTSEPVLTEAAFVLARDGFDADELFALAEAGVLRIGLRFEDERASLRVLMQVSPIDTAARPLELAEAFGELVLVHADNNVVQCLRRLNAQLARHWESLSARSGSANSEHLLLLLLVGLACDPFPPHPALSPRERVGVRGAGRSHDVGYARGA